MDLLIFSLCSAAAGPRAWKSAFLQLPIFSIFSGRGRPGGSNAIFLEGLLIFALFLAGAAGPQEERAGVCGAAPPKERKMKNP